MANFYILNIYNIQFKFLVSNYKRNYIIIKSCVQCFCVSLFMHRAEYASEFNHKKYPMFLKLWNSNGLTNKSMKTWQDNHDKIIIINKNENLSDIECRSFRRPQSKIEKSWKKQKQKKKKTKSKKKTTKGPPPPIKQSSKQNLKH